LFLHQDLAPPAGGCDLICLFLKASMAGIKPPPVAKGRDLATWQAVYPELLVVPTRRHPA